MLSRIRSRSILGLSLATGIYACGGAPQTTANPDSSVGGHGRPPILAAGASQSQSTPTTPAPAPKPPFLVTGFTDVTSKFTGAPKLQSFAFARFTYDDVQYWIFIAGRTNGFHGFNPPDEDFPKATANTKIWVIKDVYGSHPQTFSMDVSRLPSKFSAIVPQWQSSNPLYFQDFDKGVLWIAGGYGPDGGGTYQTFPLLSAVKLDGLVYAVVNNNPQALMNSIAFTTTPLAQSTGGEMLKLPDNNFYVVMGHNFQGKYSTFVNNNQQNTTGPNGASQTYLNAINQFQTAPNFINNTIAVTPGKVFTVANSTSTVPSVPSNPLEFARRDLNVTYTAMQDGAAGIGVYGGVFTPNPTQLNYYFPIYLGSGAQQATIDNSYEQMMSAYSSAKMVFYSKSQKSTYTTFFGGISRWSFDYTINEFVENARIGNPSVPTFSDGAPWINTITTLVHNWNPPTKTLPTYEVAQPSTTLPGFLGSEALLIPNTSGSPQFRVGVPGTDITDFDALPRGSTFTMGYLYGGIKAMPTSFYNGVQTGSGGVPTTINDRIYQVSMQIPTSN